MTSTPLTLGSRVESPASRSAHGRGCPLASQCSCVFQRIAMRETGDARADVAAEVATPRDTSASAVAEPAAFSEAVAEWTAWGWNVVASAPDEVVLQRIHRVSFCANLGLVVVTGALWLLYWVPRARHPRVDSVTLTLEADGTVRSSSRLH
ncbi:hypothetical protein [Frondihabitans cladoniiphilus]|uniref:Uncharacterized protein n=1 Tax=Frondihabitans cladoniiphilus TaxID=715785 RepID=A0ABP8WC31_9MICO